MIFSRIVGDTQSAISRILEGLNGRLTLHENIQAIQIVITDTGAADSENTITHKLGRTPTLYLYNISKAGIVYDSRRDEWDTVHIYVKCSVANATVRLTIL